jgi:hypothetical protein
LDFDNSKDIANEDRSYHYLNSHILYGVENRKIAIGIMERLLEVHGGTDAAM